MKKLFKLSPLFRLLFPHWPQPAPVISPLAVLYTLCEFHLPPSLIFRAPKCTRGFWQFSTYVNQQFIGQSIAGLSNWFPIPSFPLRISFCSRPITPDDRSRNSEAQNPEITLPYPLINPREKFFLKLINMTNDIICFFLVMGPLTLELSILLLK